MSPTASPNDDGAANFSPFDCLFGKVFRSVKAILRDPRLWLRLKSASIVWVDNNGSFCHWSHCFYLRCRELRWGAVHSESFDLSVKVLLLDHLDKFDEALATTKPLFILTGHGYPCLGVWSSFQQVENTLDLYQTWNGFESNDVRVSVVDKFFKSLAMSFLQELSCKLFSVWAIVLQSHLCSRSVWSTAGCDQKISISVFC